MVVDGSFKPLNLNPHCCSAGVHMPWWLDYAGFEGVAMDRKGLNRQDASLSQRADIELTIDEDYIWDVLEDSSEWMVNLIASAQ